MMIIIMIIVIIVIIMIMIIGRIGLEGAIAMINKQMNR